MFFWKFSCFVKFYSKQAADECKDALNGKVKDGDQDRFMVVRYATEKMEMGLGGIGVGNGYNRHYGGHGHGHGPGSKSYNDRGGYRGNKG